MSNKLIRWLTLLPEEKRLFREALLYSFRANLTVHLLPFKKYAHSIGTKDCHQLGKVAPQHKILAREISLAVRRSSRVVPWQNKCLHEALAASRLLKKRNVPYTFYLGVNRKNNKLVAHAWVQAGDYIVSGKNGHQNFTVVEKFTFLSNLVE